MSTTAESTRAGREYGEWEMHPVLRAALDAFAEHGYHGATVRDIARRINMPVPAIYYHYQNKQDLLVSLMFEAMDEINDRCAAAVEEVGEDPAARLAVTAQAVVLFEAHRRELGFLDSEIRSLEPENRAAYAAKRLVLERLLLDTVEEGLGSGTFATPHPRQSVKALLAMMQGVSHWYRPDGQLSAEELAARYARLALATVEHTGSSADVVGALAPA